LGEKFIGAINHGHALRFAKLPLHRTRRVTVRIASAGAGGAIEFRKDSADGPLLGRVDVEVNGNWEEFYERDCELAEVAEAADLFVVFTNPQNASGLMNLDSLYFHPIESEAAQ